MVRRICAKDRDGEVEDGRGQGELGRMVREMLMRVSCATDKEKEMRGYEKRKRGGKKSGRTIREQDVIERGGTSDTKRRMQKVNGRGRRERNRSRGRFK